jgi:hypothetical protein
MIAYSDVKSIVQDLVAQGLQPSRKRVRAALGDQGSYSTIGQHIDRARAELEIFQVDDDLQQQVDDDQQQVRDIPQIKPDDVVVARHLSALRLTTEARTLNSHLRAFLAVARSLQGTLPGVMEALAQRHRQSQQGLPFASLVAAPHRRSADALTAALPEIIHAG